MQRVIFAIGLLAAIVIVSAIPALFAAEPKARLTLVRSFDKGIDVKKTAVYGVAAAPDGKHVLVGGDSASAMMTLWNIETGENDQYFDIFTQTQEGSPYTPALSPDGKIAAVSTTLGKVFFIELATSNLLKKLETSVFAPSLRFSPDSKEVAMIDMDGKVSIVHGQGGAEPFAVKSQFQAHQERGIMLAWSGDGKRLATSGGDKTTRVWDAATHKELRKLPHNEWVWSVAYSRDSKVIATGTGGPLIGHPFNQNYQHSNDNTVRLWDAAEGKLLRDLKGHTERVRCLAFTPDGKQVVSGGFDGTLRAWDVANGKELAKVEGQGWIWSIDMAANSKTVVAGGGSLLSKIRGWEVFPEERLRVFRLEE